MPTAAHRRAAGAVLLVSSLTLGCSTAQVAHVPPPGSLPPSSTTSPAGAPSRVAWPAEGQASYALDGRVLSSPEQRPVPIASLAKVMTAYIAVHRLSASSHLVVDAGDVADTRRRQGRGESVVAVEKGEGLDREQALTALLLPSANNVAVMLAERVAGSRSVFVALMNRTAQELGMTDTTYTDPSGFAASTVSTARDQLLLLRAALRSSVLERVMGSISAVLP